MSVEARNNDFIWKASRLRRCQTSVPKNHLTPVRVEASFILKRGGGWLVITNFLVQESFVFTAIRVCQVRCSYKPPTRQMLFSVLQLFISMNGTLEGQSPEDRLYCIFHAIGNIILQRCRASMTKHRQQSPKVRVKETYPTWGQICCSLLQFLFSLN